MASRLCVEEERRRQYAAYAQRLARAKPSVETRAPPPALHLFRNAKREQVMEGALRAARHKQLPLLQRGQQQQPRLWRELVRLPRAAARPTDSPAFAPPMPHARARRTADTYARIEHENRLLLSKMSDIMTRGAGAGVGATAGAGAGACAGAAAAMSRSLNRGLRAKELRRIEADNLRLLHRIQSVTPMIDHAQLEADRRRSAALAQSMSRFAPRLKLPAPAPAAAPAPALAAATSARSHQRAQPQCRV